MFGGAKMAYCEKCSVDFDENNADEAAQHNHEEAPAEGGDAPVVDAPSESEEPKTE